MTANPKVPLDPERCRVGSRRDLLQTAGTGIVLAGSGLLLPAGVEESVALPVDHVRHRADKRRQRKRARLRRQRNGNAQRTNQNASPAPATWRGFSLNLANLTSDHTVTVECGGFYDGSCDWKAGFTLKPYPSPQPLFDTAEHTVYAWIDNRYWIEFHNPLIDEVWIAVADGGSVRHRCHSGGHFLLGDTEMGIGAKREFNLPNFTLSVERAGTSQSSSTST